MKLTTEKERGMITKTERVIVGALVAALAACTSIPSDGESSPPVGSTVAPPASTTLVAPSTVPAEPFPSMTTTFVSPAYGYSFRYHDRGGLAPATELWDPVNQPLDDIDFDDRFDAVETGLGNYFEGASTPIPDGVSIDEWVDEYVTPRAAGGCGVRRSQQAQITVDGQPGRIAECANRIEATVVVGGRLYLFIGGYDRAWFDAWVDTIDLRPEEAAMP